LFDQQLAGEFGKGRVCAHRFADLLRRRFKGFTFAPGEFLAQFRLRGFAFPPGKFLTLFDFTKILWPLFRGGLRRRPAAWLFRASPCTRRGALDQAGFLGILLAGGAFAPRHWFGRGLGIIFFDIHDHRALAGPKFNRAGGGHQGRIVIRRLATKGPTRARI
jgi:hypothetical protein